MTSPGEDQRDTAADGARVAEVLAQVRAGVRQRHAVQATGTEAARALHATLEDALARPTLVPPTPQSHRGWLGRPIVALKRVVYHVFLRWYLAPLVEQQNAFNRSVASALRELTARQLELQRALAQERPDQS